MLTQEQLKVRFNYDPLSGVFTYKDTTKKYRQDRTIKGKKAGCKQFICGNFYLTIRIDKKLYLLHRLAWLYFYGELPDGQIDHIDGNGINNSIGNLRDVSHWENSKNRKIDPRNKTGVSGIFYAKRYGSYQVSINVRKKKKSLGSFKCFFEACCTRKSAENKYGYHKNHGRRS